MQLDNDARFCTRCGSAVPSYQSATDGSPNAGDASQRQPSRVQNRFPIEVILPSLALGLILLSLVVPWLVVSALGQQVTIAPSDVIRAAINNKPNQIPQNSQTPDLSIMSSRYSNSRIAFGLSALFLPISLATFAIALGIKNHRVWLASTAGMFAIVSGTAWIFGIETMKSSLMAESSQGGIFGTALISELISGINSGSGVYLAIVAGVIGILTVPISRKFSDSFV